MASTGGGRWGVGRGEAGEVRAPDRQSPVGRGKEIGFYSKCDEKPLAGEGSNLTSILLM